MDDDEEIALEREGDEDSPEPETIWVKHDANGDYGFWLLAAAASFCLAFFFGRKAQTLTSSTVALVSATLFLWCALLTVHGFYESQFREQSARKKHKQIKSQKILFFIITVDFLFIVI